MTATKQVRSTPKGELVPRFTALLAEANNATSENWRHHTVELGQTLLEEAARERVSDIHVEPQNSATRIRFRIDGVLTDVSELSHEAGQTVVNQFKAMAGVDPVVRFIPDDAHASVPLSTGIIHMRLAFSPTQTGELLCVRLLDAARLERKVDDLGLGKENQKRLEEWMDNVKGMFLSVGPTGSGKTTTVYSLLHELRFSSQSIVSVEDPIEYQLDGIMQIQLDERHQLNFSEGVKSMLRLDPDYLMVGEIRDATSAHAAINATTSGRVVLSTIHARDAVGVVTALRNWGIGEHAIAESLSVVVNQRLVRKLCSHCRELQPITKVEADWLGSLGLNVPSRTWKGSGCSHCRSLGYHGRTGLFELWLLDPVDYQLLVHHADEYAIRKSLQDRNHATLIEDGLQKIHDGVTSIDEVRRVTSTLFSPATIAESRRAQKEVSDAMGGVRAGIAPL